MPQPGLSLRQPVAVWNRPLKANFKDLFKALGKGGVDAATGQWAGLGKDLVDASVAVGLGNDAGQIAWLLIYRSLAQAMASLVKDSEPLLETIPDNIDQISDRLDLSLEDQELTLDTQFFEQPDTLPILTALQVPLTQLLTPFLAHPQYPERAAQQAEAIAARLPSYFVFALDQEWRSRPSEYDLLKQTLETPFTQASRQVAEWRLYRAWLQKQIDEPMFLEPFGLRQVYVPQLAYYRRPVEEDASSYSSANQTYERVVIDLEADLQQWRQAAVRNDAIRIISGGPGSGKSSFAKIFAAHQAAKGQRVLFVPLHQFDPAGDLPNAIAEFIQYDAYLITNPLDPAQLSVAQRLLIIFDGLDELAMQGRIAKEVAQGFVREVQRQVDRVNQRETLMQVLITGREIVVQDNSSEFRQPRQILYLLPYLLPEAKRKQDSGDRYVDEHGWLQGDRRQNWWQRYGQVSGRGYTALPAELDRGNLVEITAQPLLNYLVALSYASGKLTFTETTNLNEIYFSLLKAVYERGYEDNRRHATIQGMSERDFIRILEEIALASWHGDGRTTTVQEIEQHCDSSGLRKLLAKFEEGAQAGVTRLLTAFYFRQSGGIRDGDLTFEFTHKSFGEYLTARRIVRCIVRIQTKLNEDDIDESWDTHQALVEWAKVCASPSYMNDALFEFLQEEVRLQSVETARAWQQTLVKLVERCSREWMPMEALPRKKFRHEAVCARHGEESLFAALYSCARVTNEVSNVNWRWPQSFGSWLNTLRGQRTNWGDEPLILKSLGHLNLGDCCLLGQDLRLANLKGANLNHANLSETNLTGADLSGADLSEADLSGADLSEADLSKADLSYTDLDKTNLSWADLSEADLSTALFIGTIMFGVNLSKANLSYSDLKEMDLSCTNLFETNLEAANLLRGNLEAADLFEVNLTRANLTEANLFQTNMSNGNLTRANLQGVNLVDAELSNSNLSWANLGRANLSQGNLFEANLSHANLSAANLSETDLQYANLIGADLTKTDLSNVSLESILWDEKTLWPDVEMIKKAINIPEVLKQQLGIE